MPVQTPLTSRDCRNVPSTPPSPLLKVTGALTVIVVPFTLATTCATFTEHCAFCSTPADGLIGIPDWPPSHPVPALSISRTPLLMRLYSTRHEPVAV